MSDTFAMVGMQIFFSFLRFFSFLMHASIFLQHVKIFLCIKKEKNRHKETEKPFPACLLTGKGCPNLHPLNYRIMEYKISRRVSRCLECGDKISYGRSDKKFCCEECRNRHHNHQARSSRTVKRKIASILEKNYEILDNLVRTGIGTVWISDVMAVGFNPSYVTSFRKINGHGQYGCFDIVYVMTSDRLSSISKIQNLSLNLQVSHERGDMV